MSMIKKLIALTLALAMVLSVSAFAGCYTDSTYADADKINEDCEDAVELLYALDIMVGDGKNFNPESAVTRAEMAKMIYVILNYGDDDKAVSYTGGKFFSDVASGIWYEGYVNYAAATKLVQGRPDGTFGPNDPVTCAEAAKMLLTAIGYSAADRGYTGANWDKNVLSDAAIIGLLEGYKANTNTYAPRQWVAVMFENALLNALTYDTIRPTINGLLTNTSTTVNSYSYPTMGLKYYGLDQFKSVAYATEDAYIDQIVVCDEDECEHEAAECWSTTASDDCVLFSNGAEIEETGLKAADLGQKYRVIYSVKNDEAYSVRSLSETAESRTLDMEVDVKHSTSSNKAVNKYSFTIDAMEAYFESYEIKVLGTLSGNIDVDVDELRDMIEDPARNNDIWKAIDTDVNGKIDYFYVTEYRYALVTDDATSNKYGTYIEAKDVVTDDYLVYNGEDRLYVEDCIITDDEIETDNIVKYGYDLDKDMITMEVLPLAEGVALEERDTEDGIYVLGGDEYQVADKGYAEENYELLNDGDSMDEDMDYVADGDLIVWIALSDSNYTDMADINAQLVLVLDAEEDYSGNGIREKNAIEYMTIDGETHIAAYQDKDGYVQFADIENLEAATNLEGDEMNYTVEGRLFIIHEGSKGRVYLEALIENEDATDEDNVNVQLDASTSLLDGFEERKVADLDATGSYVKLDSDKVEGENLFFFGYMDDDEPVYTVIKASDLGKGEDESAYAQVLTLDNSKGTRTTVVGGYIFSDELVSDEDDGYLYITNIGRENADGIKVDVVFSNGKTDTIVVENERAELAKGWLYGYTYSVMKDTYDLEFVYDYEDENGEIMDLVDEYVIFDNEAKTEIELDDEVVAVTVIVIDRDQNADFTSEERDEYDWDVESIEFVAIEDLTLDMIENDDDDRTYTQFTDYVYVEDGLFYVVRWEVMDTYDGHEMITDSPVNYMAQ